MDISFNVEKISNIAQDIFNLTNATVCIADSTGNIRAGANIKNINETYCLYVQRKLGPILCEKCDKMACEIAKNTQKPYSYVCHAKLFETVSPVVINGEIVAFVFLGEYVNINRPISDEELKGYAKENNLDYPTLKKNYDALPRLSDKQVDSAVRIIGLCIQKMIIEKNIAFLASNLTVQITEYIEEHLDGDLSIPEICKVFYVTKNKLYAIFKQDFNTTIKKYINNRRLFKSKELLADPTVPLNQVCESVGISDYNNFIKLFKKNYNMTPLQYRRSVK